MLRKSILFLMFVTIATYGSAFTFDSSVEGWTYDAGWGSGIVADPVWTNSLDHTGNGGGVTSNAVAFDGLGTGGAIHLEYSADQDWSSLGSISAYARVDTDPTADGVGARLHVKTTNAWTTYMGDWVNFTAADTWQLLTFDLSSVSNLDQVKAVGVHIGDGGTTTWSGNMYVDDVTIPEPSSLILLGIGLTGLVGFAVKKRK